MFAAGFLGKRRRPRGDVLNKVIRYPRHTGKRPGRKILTLLFILCISITIYLYAGQALIYWQAKGELNQLLTRVDMISKENMTLQKEIELLQDEEYLEIKARKDLGLVRPGEIIFSVGD